MHKTKIVSIVVAIYLLLALAWWSILLLRKNDQIESLRIENLKLYQEKQLGIANYTVLDDPDYSPIISDAQKQRFMIYGESAFFCISLIIGLWIIWSSANRIIKTNKQQNNFLLAITHELKTPVASIKLILQTIIKRDLSPVKIKELSEKAHSENKRLDSLINNVLLSTRLIDGYEFNLENISLDGVLEKSIEKVSTRYPDKHIQLKFDQSKISVKGDKIALDICFCNLIDNACKYADHDVVIETKLAESQAKIIIENDGSTIAKADRESIFQKFFRGGDELHRTTKGTGLGLYIVKEILSNHFGTIQYSVADRKNRFSISLPIV